MTSPTVPVEITLEFTPNPETLKYSLNRQLLLSGAEYFVSIEDAEPYSPLAVKLLQLDDIGAVMIGPDFITVTILTHDHLRELNQSVIETIKEHLEAGETVCTPREQSLNENESQEVRQIREVLDEVRPALAMDGGDITFQRYEDGVVYLHMMGSCSGCPSSSMTLKMGILSRLQQVLPDVREVVPI